MKCGTNKNGKFEHKALFVVSQIVMPQYKYRQLMTRFHFKDNLASESKHDHGFKIKPLTDMMKPAFQQLEISEKCLSRDETTKSYGHNSAKQFMRGKPEMSDLGLISNLMH
jgi:uncharacterized protein YajQ (UPF0234 family)